METLIDIVLLSFLVLTALAVAKMHDLFAMVMLFGIYSLISASLFLDLDAADVAFTEASVGAGISTLLMLASLKLVGRYEHQFISEAVARYGDDNDFIGHIGGDDYVLITTPDLYPRICQAVIDNFDKKIPGFYDEQDRQRGCIIGENRQGQEVKFPLATISIAVVTNVKRKFKNHIQYGEVAAEMKEHAKTVAGSNFMVDQRGDDSRKGKKDRKLISLQDIKRSSKGN
ncbi:MAG: DUF4040 domain-containing protein [Deltaproteobacteria bacterium]